MILKIAMEDDSKKLLLSQLKDNFFKVSTKDFNNRDVILSYHDFIADYSLKLNDLVFKSKFEILEANMKDPSSQEILDKKYSSSI